MGNKGKESWYVEKAKDEEKTAGIWFLCVFYPKIMTHKKKKSPSAWNKTVKLQHKISAIEQSAHTAAQINVSILSMLQLWFFNPCKTRHKQSFTVLGILLQTLILWKCRNKQWPSVGYHHGSMCCGSPLQLCAGDCLFADTNLTVNGPSIRFVSTLINIIDNLIMHCWGTTF